MLSSRCVLGANVKVLNSSDALLVEATRTHTTGSRQYTAPTSRRPVASGLAGCGRRRRTAELPDPGCTEVSGVISEVMGSLLLSEGAAADQLQEAEREHEG